MMLLVVMLGGAAGAVCRYLVDEYFQQTGTGTFPVGTLLVNISGSLMAGFVLGLVVNSNIPELWAVGLLTGFLGAYTTFSTWMVQSADMLHQKELTRLFLNIAGQLAAGILAAFSGLALAGFIA